jgi:hypothetical protein
LIIALYSKYFYWDGGHGYGPRYLLDLTAIFCLFLVVPLDWIWRRPFLRVVFLTLGLISVGIQSLGAYLYDTRWDAQALTQQENFERLRHWDNSQILFHLRKAASLVEIRLPSWDSRFNSANAPAQLGATYQADLTPLTVRVGEAIVLRVEATNTGHALWLDKPERYYGAVRLGWSWWRNGQEVEPRLGREDLPYAVAPGGSIQFEARPIPPAVPGDYILKVGLVSELVTFFRDRGVPELEIPVKVIP